MQVTPKEMLQIHHSERLKVWKVRSFLMGRNIARIFIKSIEPVIEVVKVFFLQFLNKISSCCPELFQPSSNNPALLLRISAAYKFKEPVLFKGERALYISELFWWVGLSLVGEKWENYINLAQNDELVSLASILAALFFEFGKICYWTW